MHTEPHTGGYLISGCVDAGYTVSRYGQRAFEYHRVDGVAFNASHLKLIRFKKIGRARAWVRTDASFPIYHQDGRIVWARDIIAAMEQLRREHAPGRRRR